MGKEKEKPTKEYRMCAASRSVVQRGARQLEISWHFTAKFTVFPTKTLLHCNCTDAIDYPGIQKPFSL